MTKESVKESMLAILRKHDSAPLEELVITYEMQLSKEGLGTTLSLLAELVAEEKVREFRYRAQADRKAKSFFFLADAVFNTRLTRAEMSDRVRHRPLNFEALTPEQQWNIDKALGILDL